MDYLLDGSFSSLTSNLGRLVVISTWLSCLDPLLLVLVVRFGDVTNVIDSGSKLDTGSEAGIMRKYQVLSLVCWGLNSTLLCSPFGVGHRNHLPCSSLIRASKLT